MRIVKIESVAPKPLKWREISGLNGLRDSLYRRRNPKFFKYMLQVIGNRPFTHKKLFCDLFPFATA